jgi:hypothetical protein
MPYAPSLPKRPLILRALVGLGALLLTPLALAQTAIAYRLSFPEEIARIQYIAPGQVGDFAFTVTSESATSGNAVIGGSFDSQAVTLTEYAFSSNDSTRCALPQIPAPSFFMTISFAVGPVAPGETLTCRYRVARAASSINDLGFRACAPGGFALCGIAGPNVFRFGSLPDLALSAQQVLPTPAGSNEPVFRLQLTNRSNHAVLNRTVTTECREFNGGIFDPMPYVIESDFPGGCTSAAGEICLLLTGQRHESFGFNFGLIPAGGSVSCLVRLRHHPGQPSTPSTDLYFVDYSLGHEHSLLVLPNSGGIAIDPNTANDRARLALAGAGSAAPIPMSRNGLMMLALTLGLVGLGFARRLKTAAKPKH